MQLVRYSPDKKEEWNNFVSASKNGTFILMREYIEYHGGRFDDCSFLFYERRKLLALLPAHSCGDVLYSHQGLTYGGLVLSYQVTALQVLDIFKLLLTCLSEEYGITRLIYRTIPAIYHTYPSLEDLYALFRYKAVLTERKLSSAIFSENAPAFRKLVKRKINRARNYHFTVCENYGLSSFWQILEQVLAQRHHTRPVHTLDEISLLMERFPGCIRLYTVCSAEKVIAGSVVYETAEVAHLQYIAASEEGKSKGALDLLFDYLIHDRYAGKRYVDFGVSTEEGGWKLNEGLLFQKEGFGARAVLYDTYEIETDQIKNR